MNIDAMTPQQLKQALDDSCIGNDNCRAMAGITKGAAKRRLVRYAAQHSANAIALADKLYGAPSASEMNMSADDLLADLLA